MKLNRTLFALAALLSQSLWATSGPSTGGGGFVVSCPATPVSAATVELLDVYQGREELRFTMATATGSLSEDYFQAADRTYTIQGHPDYADENRASIMDNLRRFMQSTRFVDSPADLPKADDLGTVPWIPSQCTVSQVAYFSDAAATIYVLRSIWKQLDSVNQAALVHHELWGKAMRDLGERTSVAARFGVAHVYAVGGLVSLNDGIAASSLAYSASPMTITGGSGDGRDLSNFHATKMYSIGGEILRLQFSQLNGRPQLAKTWVDLPYMDWNLAFGRSASRPEIIGCVLQTPGVDFQFAAPVQGSMTKDLAIVYEIKTGEPIRLTLKRGTDALGSGMVGGSGSGCEGGRQGEVE